MFDIEDQETDTGSEGVGSGLEANNRIAVGSHSEVALGPVEAQGQAAAVALLGGAKQEPTDGYVFQLHSQFSWIQMQMVKLFPQTGNGLMKRTPSAQAEVWLILFESQQVLVCLLGSEQTCAPAVSITDNLYSRISWLKELKLLDNIIKKKISMRRNKAGICAVQ